MSPEKFVDTGKAQLRLIGDNGLYLQLDADDPNGDMFISVGPPEEGGGFLRQKACRFELPSLVNGGGRHPKPEKHS